MKKLIFALNVLFFLFTAVMCGIYKSNYSLLLKALTASGFVAIGLVNLIYTLVLKKKSAFPALTFAGLVLCMAGDMILFNNFILGAAVFVLGHIVYIAAYCFFKKPCFKDIIPCAVIAVASVAFLMLYPAFNFGSAVMTAVALVYALVISFMLGKAVSNVFGKRDTVSAILVLGSLLFFVSDIALAFNIFGGSPAWSNTLCMFTYFPGQCIIAFSLYLYNINEAK